MRLRTVRVAAAMVCSYLALAVFQTWPLARHLSTHLTGEIGGDAGVYVWNTWVFRHQLIDLGQSPLTTMTVLPLDGETNLGLHNYTMFANLLTLPLQPIVGVVAAFNLVYILNVALTGIGMYLLARRVIGRSAEAWIAGALFACSPFLVARGDSHFSLAAAAPLPFFLYFLDRAWSGTRVRDAAAAGVAIAWAGASDPYYAVYCVMLTAVFVGVRVLVVEPGRARTGSWHGRMLVDVAIAALVCAIVGVRGLADGALQIGSLSISMRTLYTPMLILTVLVLARIWLVARPHISWRPIPMGRRLIGTAGVMVVTAGILLSPELHAIVALASEGKLTTAPVPWRSSAPGVDLLAFFVPNPTHPLAPRALTGWIASGPGGFDENVVSVSLVGLLILAAAWRWAGYRPARFWTVVTLGFASLAVGPFVRVWGWQTAIPTPWTLLRYVPLIGEARMPQRFAVLVTLGLAILIAGALAALGRRFPASRRRILVTAGVLLLAEFLPAPRHLYSAAVPKVYRVIAADPRPVRVMELPFGIRDGLSSLGNYTAASQFYQTVHGKQLIGGYLSRVPEDTKAYYRARRLPQVLLMFSERRIPPAAQLARARAGAAAFLAYSHLGYVVIDRGRTIPELRAFAIEALGLTKIASDGPIELYVPETVSAGAEPPGP